MKSSKQSHFRLILTLLILGPMSLSACTWVKKTPEAAKVRIVPADRVKDCASLGSVKTRTQDKISIVNRNADKVKTELETLAQKDAADMGGDTIVASSKVVEGQQSFNIYKCLK